MLHEDYFCWIFSHLTTFPLMSAPSPEKSAVRKFESPCLLISRGKTSSVYLIAPAAVISIGKKKIVEGSIWPCSHAFSGQLDSSVILPDRPFHNFLSVKIRCTTFLNLIKFADILIVKL